MSFVTKEFLLFFVVCAAGYFCLPHRFRWLLLLVASYVFYAAGEAQHLLLLITVSLTAYAAALFVEWSRDERRRRIVLWIAVVAMLAPLFTYKYLAFFLGTVSDVAAPPEGGWATLDLGFLLPLGISFFTFQAIAYVIDVYKGDYRAERHLGVLSLYISFFPQLIAGPIERARRLLPQFRRVARLDPEAVVSGGRLILWGAFKKLVIADNLAPYVDAVYADPTSHTGLPLLLATVFFAFQIYCDFSAYIDIARGAARILGIELMRNFDRPYGAVSIADFWHRWHIALSTWFRDYVYIPLGGNRKGLALQTRNILVVFLLSGLWHGANWTFVLWGGLHGLYMLLSLLTTGWRRRFVERSGLLLRPGLHHGLQVATTFGLVCFAWIFFRAASLGDAIYVATHLFHDLPQQLVSATALAEFISAGQGTPLGFWTLVAMLAALLAGHVLPEDTGQMILERAARWQRWGAYYALTVGVMFFGPIDTNAFIYFRF